MKIPIYNKSDLLYNLVFGKIQYIPPNKIVDYDSMYSLISPFILTKELFEKRVISTNKIITPIVTNPDFKNEMKETQTEMKNSMENRITITFNENPPSSYIPPSNNLQAQLIQPVSSTKPIPPSHQSDPLFWNIYIAINGIDEYQSFNGKYTKFIVDEKQKIVNYISTQVSLKTNEIKAFMKENKITGVSMKEMLSGILSNEPVNFKNVSLYCLFYKINITFVNNDKRIYLEVKSFLNEYNNVYIEFYLKSPHDISLPAKNQSACIPPKVLIKTYKYIVITNNFEKQKIMTKIEEYYKLESVTKPIGGISLYKVEDLKIILEKLNINLNNDSKLKKNELYNMIDEKIKEII